LLDLRSVDYDDHVKGDLAIKKCYNQDEVSLHLRLTTKILKLKMEGMILGE